MNEIGRIKEIWRYPAKSMGGETLVACDVSKAGLVGDRLWAVVDADSGEIKSARQWPRLIELRAEYVAAPVAPGLYGAAVPPVRVSGPDGFVIHAGEDSADARLSEFMGKPCRLAALQPPTDHQHYRLARQRAMTEVFEEIDLLPDEGIPDFSGTPEAMYKILEHFVTPPGTYFDSFPLHVVTTSALGLLAERGGVDTHRARFRPNLVVELYGDAEDVPEFAWVGQRLQFGGITAAVEGKTLRCSVPGRAQPMLGVAAESKMTRAMVDVVNRHMGVYASIHETGRIAVGDPVFMC